jgi:hemoglobin/transferrin/lactoferrin receptor protein
MNFYTKKPTLSTIKNRLVSSSNAFVRYSSAYSEKSVHGEIDLGGNKIGSLTSVTCSDFDHVRQGKNRYGSYPDWGKRSFYTERVNGKDSILSNNNSSIQKPTDYSQYDFLQKILFKPGKNTEHIFNLQYSISSNIHRYDRLTETESSGKFTNAQWYYGPQKRLMAAYHFSMIST